MAFDERGRSPFERLQRRLTLSDLEAIARVRAEVPVVFYAFDRSLPGATFIPDIQMIRTQRVDGQQEDVVRQGQLRRVSVV